jgi:hypothetical protein
MMVEMGFVQIIEFQTSRLDEVEALGRDISDKLDDGRPSSPTRTTIVADRTTIAADRDRPGYYLNIVEFASYEAAMENSSHPEIGELAARLAKLCDSPPKFHNLDVREVWQSSNPT